MKFEEIIKIIIQNDTMKTNLDIYEDNPTTLKQTIENPKNWIFL